MINTVISIPILTKPSEKFYSKRSENLYSSRPLIEKIHRTSQRCRKGHIELLHFIPRQILQGRKCVLIPFSRVAHVLATMDPERWCARNRGAPSAITGELPTPSTSCQAEQPGHAVTVAARRPSLDGRGSKSRQRRWSRPAEDGALTSRSRCARRTDRPLLVMPPLLVTVALDPGDAACCEARPDGDGDDVCGRPRGLRWRVQRKEPGWLVGEQRQVSLPPVLEAPHEALEVEVKADGFAMVVWVSDYSWLVCRQS
ncbi:hypothetical protein D1007_22554 [Hordeum vulgare]|nr:hypothetical protein D1007_22554 [Hordeum vulgare]